MPLSGASFIKNFEWLNDPQRNEKIFNARLDEEFGDLAGAINYASRASIDIRALGAICDGAHAAEDTAALNAARLLLEAGLIYDIIIPIGTTLVNADAALAIANGTGRIIGYGSGSILKAADSASLSAMIAVYSNCTGMTLQNFLIDGNRGSEGLDVASSWGVYNSENRLRVISMEFRECARAAIGLFGPPDDILIQDCYIHDIGMIADDGVNNIGVALIGEATNLKVLNSSFKNIYPLEGPIGDSSGINMNVRNAIIRGNTFFNVLNVTGGMCAVGDGNVGATDINAVVEGNHLEQTIRFQDIDAGSSNNDGTCGIEIMGGNATVIGNTVTGITADGIRVEEQAAGVAVIGNVIYDVGDVAINCIGTPSRITAVYNIIDTADYGMSLVGSGDGVVFAQNNLVDVTNTTSGAKIIKYGNVGGNNVMVFSDLPAAADNAGLKLQISDCNTAVFNATAATGGAGKVPVFSDGTDWKVG